MSVPTASEAAPGRHPLSRDRSRRDRSLSPPSYARGNTEVHPDLHGGGSTDSIQAGDRTLCNEASSEKDGAESGTRRGSDAKEGNTIEGAESKTGEILAIGPGMTTLPGAPDGGVRAWLQVLGAFIMFMNSWGVANSFSAYQTAYEQIGLSGKSASDIAWIGSVQFCLLFFVSAIAGPLIDIGYFPYLHFSGAVLTVFALMMTSISKEYWQVMLSQGLLQGIAAGLLFVPALATLATYFDRKRALAMGIAAAGSSAGGVVYPILLNKVRQEIDLGWATRIIGFTTLGTFSVSLAVMRSRVPPGPPRALLQPRAFLEPTYSLFIFAAFLGFLALYIPFFFVTQYATEVIGVGPSLAPYLLTIINAASVFGRIIPGCIADKAGPLNVLIPCAACCTVLTLVWIRIKTEAGIVIFCALYGFFSGAYVSLPPATMAMISKDLSQIGTRMGQCFFVFGLGVLPGTPIGGALVSGDNYLHAQIFCGLVLAGSTCAMICARASFTGLKVFTKA